MFFYNLHLDNDAVESQETGKHFYLRGQLWYISRKVESKSKPLSFLDGVRIISGNVQRISEHISDWNGM